MAFPCRRSKSSHSQRATRAEKPSSESTRLGKQLSGSSSEQTDPRSVTPRRNKKPQPETDDPRRTPYVELRSVTVPHASI